MRLREIMNPDPQTVEIGTDLELAREKMAWTDVRALPVLDSGAVVGLLSEHDVLAFLSAPPDIGRSIPVVDMVMKTAQTASPSDSLTEAAARMASLGIACLPITERRKLVGVVTTSAVLRAEVRESLTSVPVTLEAQDVMTADPLTAFADDCLLDAAGKMQNWRVGHLPVIDRDHRVVGVLSDLDIRIAVGDPTIAFYEEESAHHKRLRVRDGMSTRTVSVACSAPLRDVSRLFVDHRLSAVVVVDDDQRLVGLISYLDLLRAWV